MKLYYYGKSFDRHNESTFKGSIYTADVEHALTLERGTQEFEDYIEDLCDKFGVDYMSVVTHLVNHFQLTTNESLDQIKDGLPVDVLTEECEYGLGVTKEKAKLAYVNIADNDDEDW